MSGGFLCPPNTIQKSPKHQILCFGEYFLKCKDIFVMYIPKGRNTQKNGEFPEWFGNSQNGLEVVSVELGTGTYSSTMLLLA